MRRISDEVKACLTKARESALLAVDIYNRPSTSFRAGGYIVLMAVAWTALFHAIFLKDKIKPFYTHPRLGRNVRYVKIDGDKKRWELAECIRHFYGGKTSAAKENLEFFIGLRNKIEHRDMPQLDDQIFGECQALLLNFEALILKEFGHRHSLNESLAISLQFSTITPEGKAKAIRHLQTKSYQSVIKYVERFRSSLSSDIQQSMEFSYRVFLLPKTGNHIKSSEIAVEFIDVNKVSDESRQQLERAVTLVKTRQSVVAHAGQMRPSDVASNVQTRLKFKFSTNDHARCWKHFRIRPPKESSEPEKCDARYCQYDVPHRDYIYTKKWENLLVSTLSDPKKFEKVVGRMPQPVLEKATT